MTTMETHLDHEPVSLTDARQAGACGDSFAERALSFVVMGGAVGGAVAGAVLGLEAGTAYPVSCGTLGTMLGGGLAACAWGLAAHLWTGLAAGSRREHARGHAAPSGIVAATPSVG